jgi:prevent-host-death family protein
MNPDTDRWVRSDEARNKLRDLLDEVAHDGAHVYVLRYDKPAAVIVPVEWYERMKAATAGNGETGEPS